MRRPGTGRLAACTVAVLALGATGCGDSEPEADPTLTIYVSAPLSGPEAESGRALAEGAERALAAADGEAGGVEVELEALDVSADEGPWSPVTAAANARSATQDSTSIAYIGELESGATRTSLPVTNDAELLQVAPGSPASDLVAPFEGSEEVPPETQPTGVRTFGRLVGEEDPGRAGFAVMAVVLDAIGRADDPLSRGSVIEAFFASGEHEGADGTYSVDELGEIEFARIPRFAAG